MAGVIQGAASVSAVCVVCGEMRGAAWRCVDLCGDAASCDELRRVGQKMSQDSRECAKVRVRKSVLPES